MPLANCKQCDLECELEELKRGLCPSCYLWEKERGDADEPLPVDVVMERNRRRFGRRDF